ncbi:MAG TPA: rRNA maturation RNase YbeY [Stellaceae bacterium]|jgi:probable rRNA maturation factor|nr:rRNA maturation RNase YbeY [Stellaceae bacterium]
MTLAEAPVVEISAACPAWEQALPEAAALAETAAALALRRGEAPAAAIVDITLTDDDEQRVLNRIWRGKDAPTNVLAFPAADPTVPVPNGAPLLLGDVVLAFETVCREATEQEKPLADHLRHLVVHGVLHLLGHDHENAAEAAIMEAREIAILAELGVPNPYRDTI